MVAVLAVVLAAAACSDDLVVDGSGGGGDAMQLGQLLTNAGGENEQFSGVASLRGSSSCTGFLVDTGVAEAPATLVTNGHCVGIWDSSTVLVDDESAPMTVSFRSFVDTVDEVVEVQSTSTRWATMRGTDLAVVELDRTLGELQAQGISAYPLAPLAPVGAPITVVGVPTSGVPADETFLRRVDCTVLREPVRLLEWRWIWDGSQPNDCRGIVGGHSGSPVFDASGAVVAIINTTTIGAPPGGECDLGRPCELVGDEPSQMRDTSYAQPVDVLSGCIVAGRFALGDGCALEAPDGVSVEQLSIYGRSPWTWSAEVSPGSFDEVALKVGPITTTDCREADGYGEPAPPAPVDEPLPDAEGTVLLCVAGARADGSLSLAQAGFARATTDLTPPGGPSELGRSGSSEEGYFAEPSFNPPDLSDFLLAYGPLDATDCADESQYFRYRRVPLMIEPSELPVKVCVIGFDNATNETEPVEFVLD